MRPRRERLPGDVRDARGGGHRRRDAWPRSDARCARLDRAEAGRAVPPLRRPREVWWDPGAGEPRRLAPPPIRSRSTDRIAPSDPRGARARRYHARRDSSPRRTFGREAMRESLADKRKRATRIVKLLERAYPDARIALTFATPLELVVATILAAQCTDERVNVVTRELFKKYRTAADYAEAHPATLEGEIHSCGFFRAKARSIGAMARALIDRHGGRVPETREELPTL